MTWRAVRVTTEICYDARSINTLFAIICIAYYTATRRLSYTLPIITHFAFWITFYATAWVLITTAMRGITAIRVRITAARRLPATRILALGTAIHIRYAVPHFAILAFTAWM